MSDIDWTHIAALLEVIERSSGHSGKLNSIANSAMAELLAINSAIKAEANARFIEIADPAPPTPEPTTNDPETTPPEEDSEEVSESSPALANRRI